MPRKQIQRSSEATRACAAAVPAPVEPGVATTDAATSLKPAPLDPGSENDRVGPPSAAPPRAEAPFPARREGALSLEPSSAPVETDIETRKAKTAPDRAPLDGDLTRRRWRSLIGRHPPKALSRALMDRILAWREQVAESGDMSPRSRAILTAVLARHEDRRPSSKQRDQPGSWSPQRSIWRNAARRSRACTRARRRPSSRHGRRRGLRMGWANIWQSLRRRSRHHRRAMERTPLLRPRPRRDTSGRTKCR